MKRNVRILSLAMVLALLLSSAAFSQGFAESDAIVLTGLVIRQNATDSTEAEELWIFKYLEYWFAQQGYNVDFELEQCVTAADASERLNLLFSTNDLPDFVFGNYNLSTTTIMDYGINDSLILNWEPYLNETDMPNAVALLAQYPEALSAATAPDGGVYALPMVSRRGWGQSAGQTPAGYNLWIDKTLLEEYGLDMPTTSDEFLDVLRAFKEKMDPDCVPMVTRDILLEIYIWGAMGHYATTGLGSPSGSSIKDGELQMPYISDEYRTFVEFMNTLYTEGLISPDFYTMDTATEEGMMSARKCGVIGNYGLASTQINSWGDWVALPSFTIGDNDKPIYSTGTNYQLGRCWASAKTEYPELLAMMFDYLYSPEGSVYYYCGPQEGKDPTGLIEDGWYLNEEGVVTNNLVVSGAYGSFELYAQANIYPAMYELNYIDNFRYIKTLSGIEDTTKTEIYKDAITGADVEITWVVNYTPDNPDGYMRHQRSEILKDRFTTINLPPIYMNEEDSEFSGEVSIAINEYGANETAKFITGQRPLDEIEDFVQELKDMGADRLLEIRSEAYATYLQSIFG